MKLAGWLGVVLGLLFCGNTWIEMEPTSLPEILQVLQAGTPTILLGVLFLLLDWGKSASNTNA